MEHAAEVLGIPMSKVLRNIEDVRFGKVKQGDIIAVAGFGAGLSWAGAIIKWG
jgi:3-oxoacyl-[acyl-carrier-protein] synthase-3